MVRVLIAGASRKARLTSRGSATTSQRKPKSDSARPTQAFLGSNGAMLDRLAGGHRRPAACKWVDQHLLPSALVGSETALAVAERPPTAQLTAQPVYADATALL